MAPFYCLFAVIVFVICQFCEKSITIVIFMCLIFDYINRNRLCKRDTHRDYRSTDDDVLKNTMFFGYLVIEAEQHKMS